MDGWSSWQRLRRPGLVGLVVIALAIGVFKVPLASILFVGLALLCPLMMLGMHGSGRDHAGRATGTHDLEPGRHAGAGDSHPDAGPREGAER